MARGRAVEPPARGSSSTKGMQDFSNRYRGAEQVEVERGGWFEFEEIGDELVGEYRGMQPFRNGVKGTMKLTDGKVTVFSCATLLRGMLEEVNVGDNIAIVLAGFERSGKASPLKVFQVFRLPR